MVFPLPVAPATSKCGIVARSAHTGSPAMSRPIARISSPSVRRKGRDSRSSRMTTASRCSFGISIPTFPLPGMGASTRTPCALSASARSSARAVKRLTLMPEAGSNSKRVMVGPRVMSVTSASIPKVSKVSSRSVAVARRTGRRSSRTSCGRSSKSVRGGFL